MNTQPRNVSDNDIKEMFNGISTLKQLHPSEEPSPNNDNHKSYNYLVERLDQLIEEAPSIIADVKHLYEVGDPRAEESHRKALESFIGLYNTALHIHDGKTLPSCDPLCIPIEGQLDAIKRSMKRDSYSEDEFLQDIGQLTASIEKLAKEDPGQAKYYHKRYVPYLRIFAWKFWNPKPE